MKPIGMDKNGVLAYEFDRVLYNGQEWEIAESHTEGIANIWRENDRFNFTAYHVSTRNIEVVNVSDRTNYERYFADLCDRYEVWDYMCKGVYCEDCIVDGSLCNDDLALCMWLDESAVKL